MWKTMYYEQQLEKYDLVLIYFTLKEEDWGKPKNEAVKRICDTCFILEDEYHCLIECPMFFNERKMCLPSKILKKKTQYV